MVRFDADGRLDAVGSHVNQESIQFDELLTRHPLRFSVIGDAAKQHTAIGIGKRRDFICQVISGGALRTATGKLDLIELPSAVFAQTQLALNLVSVVSHPTFPAQGTSWFSVTVSTIPPARSFDS